MKKLFTILFSLCVINFAQAQVWMKIATDTSTYIFPHNVSSVTKIFVDAKQNIYTNGFLDNNIDEYVAVWNDTVWARLGTITNSPYPFGASGTGNIVDMVADSIGKVYVSTSDANGIGVSKWNGTTWTTLLSGYGTPITYNFGSPPIYIEKIARDASGNIYVAGTLNDSMNYNCVGKWDGTAWSELGGLNALDSLNVSLTSLCVDATGNVYAAHSELNYISDSTYYVAKYNGTSWSKLGVINSVAKSVVGVTTLCTDAAGNVYASGDFTNSNNKHYIAKWNGTNWSQLGGAIGFATDSTIDKVYCDAKGNIYAAGNFVNSSGKRYVARWNGTNWSELGGLNGLAAKVEITAIGEDKYNNIYATGAFYDVNNNWYIAKFASPCATHNPTANFTLTADPNIAHKWFAVNQCTGAAPLRYTWAWGDGSANDTGATPSHTYAAAAYYKVCVTAADSNNCSATYCDSSYLSRMNGSNSIVSINVVNQLPNFLGVNQISNGKEGLVVYPSPASQGLFVSGYSLIGNTIAIYDLVGRLVLSRHPECSEGTQSSITNQQIINVEGLPTGIYFLKATNEKGYSQVVKFVKE